MTDNKDKVIKTWEVPNIDLNLRHYSGSVVDVFNKIKSDIVTYLSTPFVHPKLRAIYSAIYHAFEYYEVLSPEFTESNTFLDSTIKIFNEDFEYLSQNYTSDDPFDSPVVSLSARVKSPLSFVEKVKNKVNEYLTQNRDFSYFNESLRDIIGIRIIIDPPSNIKSQGLQAESDYLYNIFYDLMTYRGILGDSNSIFKFLDVNTRYDKTKLEKMKKSKYPGKAILAGTQLDDNDRSDLDSYRCIVIPQTRPDFMESIDSKVKDYHFYPKKNGYQSIHICVSPKFDSSLEKRGVPDCILPSKVSDYSIEYQFRDARENAFSILGPASHGNLKPYEKIYHRLAVPSFIEADDSIRLLKPRSFGENYQKFYGPSFEDRFNIPYPLFSRTFDEETQNDILAEKKEVSFDQLTNSYYVSDILIPICVRREDAEAIKRAFTLKAFIENSHIYDSVIVPTDLVNPNTISNQRSPIKLYKFITPYKELSKNIEQSNPRENSKLENNPAAIELDDDL